MEDLRPDKNYEAIIEQQNLLTQPYITAIRRLIFHASLYFNSNLWWICNSNVSWVYYACIFCFIISGTLSRIFPVIPIIQITDRIFLHRYIYVIRATWSVESCDQADRSNYCEIFTRIILQLIICNISLCFDSHKENGIEIYGNARRVTEIVVISQFLDFWNDNKTTIDTGASVRGNGSWLPTLRPTLTKWNIIIKAATRRRGRRRPYDCSLCRGLAYVDCDAYVLTRDIHRTPVTKSVHEYEFWPFYYLFFFADTMMLYLSRPLFGNVALNCYYFLIYFTHCLRYYIWTLINLAVRAHILYKRSYFSYFEIGDSYVYYTLRYAITAVLI